MYWFSNGVWVFIKLFITVITSLCISVESSNCYKLNQNRLVAQSSLRNRF